MNTIEMKINFAEFNTNQYSWQLSTIQTPYENNNLNCHSWHRRLPSGRGHK